LFRQDRFLAGILAFVGLLILGAIILFISRAASREYRAGDSPEDVVYNYTLALSRGDYSMAYSYLSDGDGKPTEAEFQGDLLRMGSHNEAGLRIENTQLIGEEAIVSVSVLYGGNGPFDSGYSFEDTARLRQEGGVWKLVYMPGQYWNYSWYNEDIKTVP